MLIGLMAYAEAGKSEIARILAEQFQFTRVSFSEPITQGLLAINPIVQVSAADWENIYRDFSKSEKYNYTQKIDAKAISFDFVKRVDFYYFADLYYTFGYILVKRIKMVREYYQRFGTGFGRAFDENIWVDFAAKSFSGNGNYVIENVRFENEAKKILLLNGHLIKVSRCGFDKPVNSHISDTGIPFHLATHVIDNDGTVNDLEEKIINLFRELHFNAQTKSNKKEVFTEEILYP